MRRVLLLLVMFAAPTTALAQEHPDVVRAKAAYDALDFAAAITLGQRALTQRIGRDDRVITTELLGMAYGALDSTRQAVEAFKQLIFLDPDREPDVEQVSPRITSLYASALGQVLVVRRLGVDSATFIAGQGGAPVRFQLSRSARVMTRVVGSGLDMVVDSQNVGGAARVDWRGIGPDGNPVPAGLYQVIVTAFEGSSEFSAAIDVVVLHGAVDTAQHLASLPGYTERPESVSPPRGFKPLGLAVLFAGVTAGASLALENTTLGGGERREIGGVTLLTVGVGLFLSLRKPDPVPVEANIDFNRLLREQLAAENSRIVEQNVARRRQVVLTVVERREER